MIDGQIRCVDDHGSGSLDHRIRIAPAQHSFSRTGAAWPFNKYIEQFAQRLTGNKIAPGRNRWISFSALSRMSAPLAASA